MTNILSLNEALKDLKKNIERTYNIKTKHSEFELFLKNGYISVKFENAKYKLTYDLVQYEGNFLFYRVSAYILD